MILGLLNMVCAAGAHFALYKNTTTGTDVDRQRHYARIHHHECRHRWNGLTTCLPSLARLNYASSRQAPRGNSKTHEEQYKLEDRRAYASNTGSFSAPTRRIESDRNHSAEGGRDYDVIRARTCNSAIQRYSDERMQPSISNSLT